MIDSDEARDPVERLAEEFLDRYRRGEAPSISEYVAAHPPWAERIRDLFPAMLALEDLKADREVLCGLSGPRSASAALPERLGDFRILRVLGHGGMGVVYEAEQESLDRRVAIKVLADAYAANPPSVQRFRREARAMARLHHTNIVSVFGVGEFEGKHFFVMQHIEGRSLDQVVRELRLSRAMPGPALVPAPFTDDCGPPSAATEDFLGAAVVDALEHGKFQPASLQASDAIGPDDGLRRDSPPVLTDPPAVRSGTSSYLNSPAQKSGRMGVGGPHGAPYWRSVAGIGAQVAAALHYAHRQGILHRDVKPSNVMLDENGGAWLTDFGLAKLLDQDDLTHSRDVVGTLRYMAPEQLEGETSARSDVYSLGLTLYELLTLRPAFDETSRHRLLRQVSRTEPPRPRSVDPEIPRDLETIVLRAVASDPGQRYATAAELADDLQRFLEDRPIHARRTSVLEHAWRWCRRNPALASLTASTLLLLLAGAIGAAGGYVRESRLRAQADRERARAEANLAIAAEAFEDVFSKVSGAPLPRALEKTGDEMWLGDLSPPAATRKEALVLEGLLKFYDRFAEQNGDSARWQRESGQAYRRVGDIQQRLGRMGEAENAYRRALELYERLAQVGPAGTDVSAEVAAIRHQLGNVALASDAFDEAFQQYARAKQLLNRSSATRTTPLGRRFQLAEACRAMGLATFLRRIQAPSSGSAGDASDAEDHLRQAMAILAELVRESPARGDFRFALAQCHANLWGAYRMERREAEAEEAKRRAIGMFEDLVDQHPENPQYRQTLAWVYAVTTSFSGAGRTPQAVAPLERARALLGGVAPPNTEVPEYRQILAHVLLDLAEAYRESGADERVDEPLRASSVLFSELCAEFPGVTRYQVGRMRSLYLQAVLENERARPAAACRALREMLAAGEPLLAGKYRYSPLTRHMAKGYMGLADVLTQTGDRAAAARAAERAIGLREQEQANPLPAPSPGARDPWARLP